MDVLDHFSMLGANNDINFLRLSLNAKLQNLV